MPDLLLGWVKKVRGSRGEMSVATRSESANVYVHLRRAAFGKPGTPPEPRELASVRAHGRRLIIRPEGVESASEAAPWIGLEMWIDSAALPKLSPGSWYAWQLLGLEVVTRDGEPVGRLCDIRSTGGGCDLWVVRAGDGHEHLIPAAASICTGVDTERGRITVDPPAGLLELNAI